MKTLQKFIALTLFCLISFEITAAENLDFYHNIGKIYVVVAVIAVVFLGIIFFIVRLDRKLSKLEKDYTNN